MTDPTVSDALATFHPAVAGWFGRSFPAPTPAQARAWPLIRAGRSTLVAAPTGSGKTLTAFLAAIDQLVQEDIAEGGLPDRTAVLYVSPLKALSNDIHVNLEQPLAGISAELQTLGLPPLEIRTAVRTGDTPQAERAAMRKRVPHILVTTPESLYVLLGSESGRQMLGHVRSVIVDEIHAIAGNKRGSHLALSLERLEALCGQPLVRVGLSATQKPIEAVADFLVGAGRDCEIIDVGHGRARDLALEVPPVPLEAVMSNDVWELVYDRLAVLAGEHRTTLVFVNTRRMAERAARHLSERLGNTVVAAHHGSLAREQRLDAEQRLKRGELRVLVATASLELGIDIGDVELVCQLGSPRSISAFLQRVGRAGHQVGGISKGRLFPSSRDDLIECAALLDAVRRGELDTLVIPTAPLDVLAQQIVAEVSCREWQEDALFALIRRAMPYADLSEADYQALLAMLAEGYTTRHGARGAYLHRDLVNRSLRGRRGGRLTALTSGGTIADNSDYSVLLEPQGFNIGTVNEDFAVESLTGDVFQLGNTSYRIIKVEPGRVRVEDAQGQPPNIPFWLGEAPGRSDELSAAVARLRGEIDVRLSTAAPHPSPLPGGERGRSEWVENDVSGSELGGAAEGPVGVATRSVAAGLSPLPEGVIEAHRATAAPHPSPLPGGEKGRSEWVEKDASCSELGGAVEGPVRAATRSAAAGLPSLPEGKIEAHRATAAPHPSPLPGGKKGQSEWVEKNVSGSELGGAAEDPIGATTRPVAAGLPSLPEGKIEAHRATAAPHPSPLPGGERGQSEWVGKDVSGSELGGAAKDPMGATTRPLAAGLSPSPQGGEGRGEGGAARTVDLMPAIDWLTDTLGLPEAAARQIVEYLARARSALGALPTQQRLIMERFFDESGGTQLVIHSPFGSRINRAWGLALRKRFCRTFNFELQAAATEDAIIFSLSTSHSFPLDEVWRYLHANSAESVLVQALLDAPLFGVRWRWNATTALALPRMAGGRKVAPQLQRMKSEDLLASVFPDQVACVENIVGEREVPDHPLVAQTLDDCLHEAMDSEGWLALLRRIEAGDIELLARDLPAPSPLAMEVLGARPYAFLDDAPLEERRTQAVLNRRWTDPESADDLGALDVAAITAVGEEAWPQARNADELHEALTGLGCIAEAEAQADPQWPAWLNELARGGRATRMQVAQDRALWLPIERLALLQSIYPSARCEPALEPLPGFDRPSSEDDALVELIRARLTGFGPLPVPLIARPLALPASAVALALTRLESEGYVLRGRFTPGAREDEWCERHLLARIHRYTVKRLRREIEPVERADFMRFLCDWQHLSESTRMQGRDALATVVEQLKGFQAAAGAWESDLLPARLKDYGGTWLDELCRSGRIVWTRLAGRIKASSGPVRGTPIVLLPRRQLAAWYALASEAPPPELSSRAQRVFETLQGQGALFFDELQQDARLLRSELEDALGELVAVGLVNADSFAGLRALLAPAAKRSRSTRQSRGGAFIGGMADAGRWALVRKGTPALADSSARRPVLDPEALEHIALTLLRRYGVVFWLLLDREADWLPPWRELLRVYHRLEARGDIRGGRFVAGVPGEQFALPEAVALLREVRKRSPIGEMIAVSAVDPLNQVGTLLPGERVPAVPGNRILYRDGVPLALLIAGKPELLAELNEDDQRKARQLLAVARR
ncbi:DEAD/DEAH box helicase [Stutzerimonas stutzeri]|uniref:DEAD/DEAH box helicase n=1 Tax=Stutzerimonas sp. CQPMC-PStu TaxID=3369415 RepID=UPI002012EC0E|nr:DEAD/DEAH box helicase [Stutzerimonas stutzeri]